MGTYCWPVTSEKHVSSQKLLESEKTATPVDHTSHHQAPILLRSSQAMGGGGVQIAVVDASKISLARENQPEAKDFAEVAKELCSAFQGTGFAYLVDHGIEPHLVQQAMRKSLEFFSLDDGVKEKMSKGPEYQGWVAQGREIFDQDEEGNIAGLRCARLLI